MSIENVETLLVYVREHLEPLFTREYELGESWGRKAGYDLGYATGHADAMAKLLDYARMMTPGLDAPASPVAAEPEPEPDMADVPAPVQRPLGGHLKAAFEYVQANPGVTSGKAYPDLKNNSALYELAKRGLVEKRGAQFFPREQA